MKYIQYSDETLDVTGAMLSKEINSKNIFDMSCGEVAKAKRGEVKKWTPKMDKICSAVLRQQYTE